MSPTSWPRRWPRASRDAWPAERRPRTLALLQRSHREPRIVELLPVELGLLLHPRPDHGLALVVDEIRDRVALGDRHAGNVAGERVRHVIERVVVVVADDDPPVTAQVAVRPRRSGKLDRLGHRPKGSGGSLTPA